MEFTPHGSFRLHRDGQLIVVEAAGPWNLELIQRYAAEVLPVVHEIARDGPWAAVVLVKDSVLFTNEAAEALREAGFRTAKGAGRVAVAYVIPPEVEGASLAPTFIRRIYEGLTPWAIFTDLPPAMAWLAERLAAYTPAAEA